MRRTSATHRGGGRDRGAAAVELALTMPLLLLFLCGIIDFGRMLNAKIILTEAAREGARAAVVTGDEEAVRVRVEAITDGRGAVQTPSTFCDAVGGAPAKVTVVYDFVFQTPFVMIAGMFGDSPDDTVPLTAKGVMSC